MLKSYFLVFRKLRTVPCECKFGKICAYKQKTALLKPESLIPESLGSTGKTSVEQEFVYDVYEKIAEHFHHTRYNMWPQVKNFLETFNTGDILCDIGCGNGKYLGANNKKVYIQGSDICANLVKIACEKGFSAIIADNLHLPFKSNYFDGAISIAVIHHFYGDEQRFKALEEVTRIVKKGGRMLVYVWAFEQEKKKYETQDVLIPWHLQDKYDAEEQKIKKSEELRIAKENEETKGEENDKVYKRYYHLFKEGELQKLAEKTGCLKTLRVYYDHENWCIECEKL